MEPYLFECPYADCGLLIQVLPSDINCGVFRHAAYRSNPNIQLPPHAPKAFIDQLRDTGEIVGCGKPLKFNGKTATICDYI